MRDHFRRWLDEIESGKYAARLAVLLAVIAIFLGFLQANFPGWPLKAGFALSLILLYPACLWTFWPIASHFLSAKSAWLIGIVWLLVVGMGTASWVLHSGAGGFPVAMLGSHPQTQQRGNFVEFIPVYELSNSSGENVRGYGCFGSLIEPSNRDLMTSANIVRSRFSNANRGDCGDPSTQVDSALTTLNLYAFIRRLTASQYKDLMQGKTRIFYDGFARVKLADGRSKEWPICGWFDGGPQLYNCYE